MKDCIVKTCSATASRFGLNLIDPTDFGKTEKSGPYCENHLYRLIDLMGPGFYPNIAYFRPDPETEVATP